MTKFRLSHCSASPIIKFKDNVLEEGPASRLSGIGLTYAGPIKEGKLSSIYWAKIERSGTDVAVKALFGEDKEKITNDLEWEEQMTMKADPSRVLKTIKLGGETFLVMEYLEGKNLYNMQDSGPLSWKMMRNIFLGVCDALAAAHERGVLHCSIAPSHVFVNDEGVKLLDFGLARQRQNKLLIDFDISPRSFCNLNFMSPEQVQRRHVDERTDVYSVGAVIYHALTGVAPFESDKGDWKDLAHQITNHAPVSPLRILPQWQVSNELDGVIMQCLAKSPLSRFQSIAELKDALSNVE